MDKLIKELKESGRYEYMPALFVRKGMYQNFVSYKNPKISIGILEKDSNFEIDILNFKGYEPRIICKLFYDASLKEVERLIKILFEKK